MFVEGFKLYCVVFLHPTIESLALGLRYYKRKKRFRLVEGLKLKRAMNICLVATDLYGSFYNIKAADNR